MARRKPRSVTMDDRVGEVRRLAVNQMLWVQRWSLRTKMLRIWIHFDNVHSLILIIVVTRRFQFNHLNVLHELLYIATTVYVGESDAAMRSDLEFLNAFNDAHLCNCINQSRGRISNLRRLYGPCINGSFGASRFACGLRGNQAYQMGD